MSVITDIDKAVASGFRPDQASSPGSALPGQHTFPKLRVGLVGTEQPANLTGRDSNIAGRDVDVGADVLAQLAHEGDAELADLIVGFAFGVEVGSSLSTSDIHCVPAFSK